LEREASVKMIGILVLAVLGLLGATVSRQLTDEFKAWTPRIIEWLIRRAVRKLPEGYRERYGEEWRSDINETPGEIGKIWVALGFLSAPRKMPEPVTTFQPLDEPTQEERAVPACMVTVSGNKLVLARDLTSADVGSHQFRVAATQNGVTVWADLTMNVIRATNTLQGVAPGKTPLTLRAPTDKALITGR
jgi:hypothetical protein